MFLKNLAFWNRLLILSSLIGLEACLGLIMLSRKRFKSIFLFIKQVFTSEIFLNSKYKQFFTQFGLSYFKKWKQSTTITLQLKKLWFFT
jgi:hypothetical protein